MRWQSAFFAYRLDMVCPNSLSTAFRTRSSIKTSLISTLITIATSHSRRDLLT